jgi:[acyl-carrier-protein] S-malonyltransferase
MQPAKEEFKETLDKTEFKKVNTPVYTNVTGKPITPSTDPNEIRLSLYEQLTSSVRWEECVLNMINGGADEFIEIGPGKVLQGLVKRVNPNVTIKGIDKVSDINLL